MSWMIIGSTGLLGQALMSDLKARGQKVVGAARKGADVNLDISDPVALVRCLDEIGPKIVVNAAALTDLDACERDPRLAHDVNAAPLKTLASWTRRSGAKLAQISTDHFYSGDGPRLHSERTPVMILNQYARSKYVGEVYAAEDPRALIVRTNITGLRGWRDRPTFAEWALDALERKQSLRLFTDYYTSTIDAGSCAGAVIDLASSGAKGVINVASGEVADKWTFVHGLAKADGVSLDWAQAASVRDLPTPRAESAGLAVARAEGELGRSMPGLNAVCAAIVANWRGAKAAAPA